jgi:hypothetical protein
MHGTTTKFCVLWMAFLPWMASNAIANEDDAASQTLPAFALMDLRETTVWSVDHFEWLEPNEEALQILMSGVGKGPMRLDLVMDNSVPPYCEVRPDPETCDGSGVPVGWMADVPQTICMDIPLSIQARHKEKLRKSDQLCLEPRGNLAFPDDWADGSVWSQMHLHQTVVPNSIQLSGTTAVLELTITETIATGLANLSSDGYGPVEIGMNEAQLGDILGPQLDQFVAGDGENCTYLQRNLDPSGLGYMVLDGTLARVSLYGDEYDVATSLVKTPNGLSIGSSIEDVKAAFIDQSLIEEEHEYLGSAGRYITWWQDDAQTRGIRFEINEENHVIAIHAGSDAITLIEGCS